jgi:hypothetical protein
MKPHLSPRLVLALSLILAALAPAHAAKPRLLVLTDIGGDPDDQQSMVRLLLYANEYELEGLIATATRDQVNPDQIRERIEAYRQVYSNLTVHAEGYPEPDHLLSLVKTGRPKRYMESVGEGKSTEASRHIIEVIDKDDPRPVWVNIWGAGTDFAQALWDVRNTRTPDEVEAFVEKVRIYDIAGQDDSGGWICHNFPSIFYIRSVLQFQAISVREARPFPTEVTGHNLETFTNEWVDKNVQNHGSLGKLYPDRRWKYEGDTPAFLHVLPNGLSDPERVHQGNWGGRFTPMKTRNPGSFNPRNVAAEKAYRDFDMYTEAADTWSWKEHRYEHSRFAPIFRWREAFQHDFAARMDWSVTQRYEDANHNPQAVFNGDSSRNVLYLTVKGGEPVTLSAEGSSDSDTDRLSFTWMHYKEPGTYAREIQFEERKEDTVQFQAPEVWGPETIHVVLTVEDNGDPSLSAYRRAVITVNKN